MEETISQTLKPGSTPGIQLTPAQSQVHDRILEFVQGKHPANKSALLNGYAGTGKTTTLVKTIQDILKLYPTASIAVTAPTHKAVQVLEKQRSLGDQVVYTTVHSLLGLKEKKDLNTGKVRFVPAYGEKGPKIKDFNIVIVDEVSMLGKDEEDPEDVDLYAELMAWVERRRIRLIMMGDPVQIPPVNAIEAEPFRPEIIKRDNILQLELSQIMRQAEGSPILDFATTIRTNHRNRPVLAREFFKAHTPGVTVIHNEEQDRIRKVLKDLFTDPRAREDADFAKVIAWRNVTVNTYNQEIRKLIYGTENLQAVMPGEKLVTTSPVIGKHGEIVLSNNSELTVVSAEIKTGTIRWYDGFSDKPKSTTVQYYATKVYMETLDSDGHTRRHSLTIDILHESSIGRFKQDGEINAKAANKAKSKELRTKMWGLFYANQEKFASVGYNYAITAHKSQGSTYQNAVIVEWDIHKNFNTVEANRIKYVAVSRAKHNLFIIT